VAEEILLNARNNLSWIRSEEIKEENVNLSLQIKAIKEKVELLSKENAVVSEKHNALVEASKMNQQLEVLKQRNILLKAVKEDEVKFKQAESKYFGLVAEMKTMSTEFNFHDEHIKDLVRIKSINDDIKS